MSENVQTPDFRRILVIIVSTVILFKNYTIPEQYFAKGGWARIELLS